MTTKPETTTVAFRVDLAMYEMIQHTVHKFNLRRPSDALRMLVEHAVSDLSIDKSYAEHKKQLERKAKRDAKKAAPVEAVPDVVA